MLRQRTAICLALLALASCTTSPLGRRQLKLFPEAQMAQMGLAAFDKMKQEVPRSRDARTNAFVACVATAIVGELAGPARNDWQVVVFEDTSANAFALPGKRIGVHTGLLAVAKNQHQLAAVLGHEVGHVVAGHSNERVSQAFATQSGLQLAQVLSGAASPTQQQLIGLLGVGAQYGILLPYSRAHETEADLLGLDLMARAGFDPQESVQLWMNMSAGSRGQPPEFLSTHPSHESRMRELRNRMPSAAKLYESARATGKRPACSR
jgi:predicted Zn-dependent protease